MSICDRFYGWGHWIHDHNNGYLIGTRSVAQKKALTMTYGAGEQCPECKGAGWVQPYGWVWDSFLGYVIKQNAPPHQCAKCHGTGSRVHGEEQSR